MFIVAEKSRRGAKCFQQKHFARYTLFTGSKQHKKAYCLTKTVKKQFLLCYLKLQKKTSATRNVFNIAILHVALFLQSPNHTKMAVVLAENSNKTDVASTIEAARRLVARIFFYLPIVHVIQNFGIPNPTKLGVARAKTMKKDMLPR